MKFLVHVTDFRGCYIIINAKDREAARRKGKRLAQKALDKCDHWYEADAYDWDDTYIEDTEEAFTEKELKQ